MRRLVPLLLVALAFSACLPVPPDWTGEGPHVVLFGDSLVYQAEGDTGAIEHSQALVTDGLAEAGYAASVSDMVGARTEDLEQVVPEIPEPGADIIVIALGTNDLHTKEGNVIDVAASLANIDDALAEANAGCIALIGVADVDAWNDDPEREAYNAGLQARAEHYGDWAAVIDAHPEYLSAPDNVHHSADGRAAYRDMIFSLTDDCAAEQAVNN